MGSYKGFFKPKNPIKYKGDPTNIIYRSSWEQRCMVYFDLNLNVLEWQSEEFFIPYKSPIDGRYHRYFPDFKIKVKTKDDTIDTVVIEVKPFAQTKQPPVQKRITRKYLTEVRTYGINMSKWAAAENYCKDRGWKFQILTEHELSIK